MNMARSTFYRERAREKADTDLRVRIEDTFPAYGTDGSRTSSGDVAW